MTEGVPGTDGRDRAIVATTSQNCVAAGHTGAAGRTAGTVRVQDAPVRRLMGRNERTYAASDLAPHSCLPVRIREHSVTCPGFHRNASRHMGVRGSPAAAPGRAEEPHGSHGRRMQMRIPTALALGAIVALTGCATRKLAPSYSSLPPPRVISRKVVRPTSTPSARATAARTSVVRQEIAYVPEPPAPPSMELLRSERSTTTFRTPGRVVPVSRSGRVQPAVAAPMRRSAPSAPSSAPVAVPIPRPATTSRPAARPCSTPCDVRSLFDTTPVCAPCAPTCCPGGT